VLRADGVQHLSLDSFKFTRVPGVLEPFALTNVGQIQLRDTDEREATAR